MCCPLRAHGAVLLVGARRG
uniref:Uncharacterized protein n=1 Tax=Arundo donax TaxID=35708 RepID=A0A0A8ZAG6_ARUDO